MGRGKKAVTLKSKVALVTGGNRGIGLAIAAALVKAGAFVIVTGRDPKALKTASTQLGKNATAIRCDVSDEQSVISLARELKKRFGRIDFLINNAGVAHALHNVQEMPVETWQEVIDTNLTGLFLVCHHVLPLMSAGSVIINNLSISAKQVFPGFSAYSASKFGALGFTDTLRLELRDKGIRVTALIPGAVQTDIWQQFWPEAPKSKMVSADTVAEAVLHILQLPQNTTIEQLHIGPASGAL
jgi:NAD(P)-dependent dehydrogenase (short-subunit alcohol dehydrogenase family)